MSAFTAILVLMLLGGVYGSALEQPTESSVEPKSSCGKDQVYTTCGSSIPETCESRGDTCKVWTQVCVKGCFCVNGTIRAANGSCVPPHQCPPRTCAAQNEVFDECPQTCPWTEYCENVGNNKPCIEIDCCTPQCRCKPGYYRNLLNKCVTVQECYTKKDRSDPKELEAPPHTESLHGAGKI